MGLILFVVMIVVPVTEIAVFVKVGGWIGLWPTIAIVILTALVGSALLRHQGLTTFIKAQQNLAQGRMPLAEVFDGLCLLFAGALLLTPGFVTDIVGLLLFVPPFRAGLRSVVGRWLAASGRVHVQTTGFDGDRRPQGPRDPNVIEGEYTDLTDDDPRDRR